MTIPHDMTDVSRTADALLKAKAESIKPVPMTQRELDCCNAMHEQSLPTMREMLAETAVLFAKHAAAIIAFVAVLCAVNCALDSVFAHFGY